MTYSYWKRLIYWIYAPGFPSPGSLSFWRRRWVAEYHQLMVATLAWHIELIHSGVGERIAPPEWAKRHGDYCFWCDVRSDGGTFKIDMTVPGCIRRKLIWRDILAHVAIERDILASVATKPGDNRADWTSLGY